MKGASGAPFLFYFLVSNTQVYRNLLIFKVAVFWKGTG